MSKPKETKWVRLGDYIQVYDRKTYIANSF